MPSILNATTTSGLVTSADNSGSLQLQTNNGTTAVTIDTSQNVGIGNTVASTINAANGVGNLVVGSGSGSEGITIYTGTTDTGGIAFADGTTTTDTYRGYINYAHSTDHMAFWTAATERMRIDSSGNLSVGTTSNSRGARLRVDGNETSHFTGYGNGYGVGIYMTPNASATGTHTVISFQNPSATTVGTITSTSSATAYNTSSDYRLKENIAPMIGALAKVAQLKPVTYTWKADGSDGQGFIAHELQEVVPDCVTGEKDAVETVDDVDADGKVIGTKEVPKYQGVDTSFLVATLTAAIQELKAELDATKAEVQALKGVA